MNTIGCFFAQRNRISQWSLVAGLLISINLSGQLAADFSASISEGCSPLVVSFTNNSTNGDSIKYSWNFGNTQTSDLRTPAAVTYTTQNNFRVVLAIVNVNNGQTASDTAYINVTKTPNPNLSISKSTACLGEYIKFDYIFSNQTVDSVVWNFGDGTQSRANEDELRHKYDAHDVYNFEFSAYNKGCSDSYAQPITITGPVAEYSLSGREGCSGDTILFALGNTTDVTGINWVFGDGDFSTNTSVKHSYDEPFTYPMKLEVTGSSMNCILEDTIEIYNVKANIGYDPENVFCDGKPVTFRNSSIGSEINSWDFGDGATSNENSPLHSYSVGDYIVSLHVSNIFGCEDSTKDTITILDNPDIELGEDWFLCAGDSAQLIVSGGDSINWSPSYGINDVHSFMPKTAPPQGTTYKAEVIDKNTGCLSIGFVRVEVQIQANWDDFIKKIKKDTIVNADTIIIVDTTITVFDDISIIIGDTVTLQVVNQPSYTYFWSPDYGILDCDSCYIMKAQPLETTVYSITVADRRDCFSKTFNATVEVREEYTIGIPTAFTPNEDNINDIIKVDGWGVKSLIEFRIYNRWGMEVFFSDDINMGWDGMYKDKPQSMDSYAFYIKAEMWNDQIVEKKGSFNLIR